MKQKGFLLIKIILVLVGISIFAGGAYFILSIYKNKNVFDDKKSAPASIETKVFKEKINDATATSGTLVPIESSATSSIFIVGSNGGTISSPDGNMMLVIPQGALAKNSRIMMSTEDGAHDVSPLDEDILKFEQYATLGIRYDPTMLPPEVKEEDMQINSDGVIPGSTSVDIVNHVISQKISMIKKTVRLEEIKTIVSPSPRDAANNGAIPNVEVRAGICDAGIKLGHTEFDVIRNAALVATVTVPCNALMGAAVIATDAKSSYFSTRPDGIGGYILYGVNDNLYRLNFSDNSVEKLISSGVGITLNPDHTSVVFGGTSPESLGYQKIVVENLETKKRKVFNLPLTAPKNSQFGDFAFSPDAKKVAVAFGPTESEYGFRYEYQGGEVYVLNIEDGSYSLFFKSTQQEPHIRGWINNEKPDVYVNQ